MARTSEKKFRELILLICARSQGDKKFGSIKLNKLLFYGDFSAYLTFGTAITGQEYFKLPKGPAPRKLLPVVEKMQQSGELAYEEIQYFGHTQKKPIALRQPDVSVFTPQEIDLVHTMIQKYWNLGASEISEKSHLFLGWKVARNKETIPYSTALVGSRPPITEEQAYGLELAPLALDCLTRANG
ncbi:MAG TPA: Panacea domain-containing protein [Candidatus Acidoferrum sp.]|nr:Panacea domain-containing protein [Candidatus Acidoferrum sp.]